MTTEVRIFQPAKNAMQSGRAATQRWILEFKSETPREVEPLMGWTSSRDTRNQLRLWFDSEEEAVAYAQRHGFMYVVERPQQRLLKPKAYADNFRTQRRLRWTH